jgi:ethanolamine utilization protein EutN|tara:strand:+ start:1160 stop:1405 length:246 start_codon:yes stop_codon:yes gene_type:complete
MIKGRVIGKVWSSRHVGALPPGALLEVQTDGGDLIVAFDPLGCDEKEIVLITQGSVAAAHFKGKTVPVDALIIASIDEKLE